MPVVDEYKADHSPRSLNLIKTEISTLKSTLEGLPHHTQIADYLLAATEATIHALATGQTADSATAPAPITRLVNVLRSFAPAESTAAVPEALTKTPHDFYNILRESLTSATETPRPLQVLLLQLFIYAEITRMQEDTPYGQDHPKMTTLVSLLNHIHHDHATPADIAHWNAILAKTCSLLRSFGAVRALLGWHSVSYTHYQQLQTTFATFSTLTVNPVPDSYLLPTTLNLNAKHITLPEKRSGTLTKRSYSLSFLGAGVYKSVYSLEHTESQVDSVLIVSKKQDAVGSDELEREVAMLRHQSRRVDTYSLNGQLYGYCTERMPGCNLRAFLQNNPELSPEQRLTIALNMAKELQRLHQAGIAHFDIKPDNFMIHYDKTKTEYTVKLIDFGFSYCPYLPQFPLLIKKGTPHYAAPEVLSDSRSSEIPALSETDSFTTITKADVWSLGVAILKDVLGYPLNITSIKAGTFSRNYLPLNNTGEIGRDLKRLLGLPEHLIQSLLQLASQMLRLTPTPRPTSDQVVAELERIVAPTASPTPGSTTERCAEGAFAFNTSSAPPALAEGSAAAYG